jgi:antitoxin ParD1/3/4
MNIYLGKHFEEFIRAQVESGRYANASEVVREALRRQEVYEVKLEQLQEMLARADAEFERGEGIDITDLDAYFEEMKERVLNRSQHPAMETVSARKAS